MRRTLPRASLIAYLETWDITATGFAQQLGITLTAARGVLRASRPRIDIFAADKIAVKLGVTPDVIWEDDWWEIRNVRTR